MQNAPENVDISYYVRFRTFLTGVHKNQVECVCNVTPLFSKPVIGIKSNT